MSNLDYSTVSMPYKCRCVDLECCYTATGLILSASLVAFIGFLASDVSIIDKYQHTGLECFDSVEQYLWWSLINLVFITSICVFGLIAVNTDGKFDNCTNDSECYCCCIGTCLCYAILIWMFMLLGAISMIIYGTPLIANNYDCLPLDVQILSCFSLGIQYLTIPTSFIALLFRCGCLVYEEPKK